MYKGKDLLLNVVTNRSKLTDNARLLVNNARPGTAQMETVQAVMTDGTLRMELVLPIQQEDLLHLNAPIEQLRLDLNASLLAINARLGMILQHAQAATTDGPYLTVNARFDYFTYHLFIQLF